MSQLQMGGGGAMRAAARIAVGVRPGLRNSPLPVEQSVCTATSRQSSGVGVSSPSKSATEATTTETSEVTVLPQWDDWYLADDGELDVPSPPPRHRLVSVPTFGEAEEATQELKDAINQLYFSGESSESSARSSALNRSPVIGAFSNPFSDHLVPTHAIQAFQMLTSSPEIQSVVASIVSDQGVWDAVRRNPAVTSFFQETFFQETVIDKEVAVTEKEVDNLSNCASSTDEPPKDGDEDADVTSYSQHFVNFLSDVKLTIIELVSKVSSYLQKIFPVTEENADGNTKASFMDKIGMQETFLGLAVLVIMVIMTKRVSN